LNQSGCQCSGAQPGVRTGTQPALRTTGEEDLACLHQPACSRKALGRRATQLMRYAPENSLSLRVQGRHRQPPLRAQSQSGQTSRSARCPPPHAFPSHAHATHSRRPPAPSQPQHPAWDQHGGGKHDMGGRKAAPMSPSTPASHTHPSTHSRARTAHTLLRNATWKLPQSYQRGQQVHTAKHAGVEEEILRWTTFVCSGGRRLGWGGAGGSPSPGCCHHFQRRLRQTKLR
jgi:hypothetical protein